MDKYIQLQYKYILSFVSYLKNITLRKFFSF